MQIVFIILSPRIIQLLFNNDKVLFMKFSEKFENTILGTETCSYNFYSNIFLTIFKPLSWRYENKENLS